jgi:hypothetical protein
MYLLYSTILTQLTAEQKHYKSPKVMNVYILCCVKKLQIAVPKESNIVYKYIIAQFVSDHLRFSLRNVAM